VREKDSTRDKEILRLHINPQIGLRRLTTITLGDAEKVMASLPKDYAPRSRKLVAQCMRKVLSYAVYPGRHLSQNPIPREWMPRIPKSANKAKSYLYPEEDAALMKCSRIPIERRITYGILMREGMRAGELSSLRWRDVDLKRGVVKLDENKTDDPRVWALSWDVVAALKWWRDEQGGEDDDLVIGLDLRDGAWWLRGDDAYDATKPESSTNNPGDLRRARVDRAELWERSKSRQPIRLHDLRATFVTVSLADGKPETWVTDRTGHRSSQMLALYTRQARTWRELDLGTFGPLHKLVPEMKRHPKGTERSRLRDLNSRPTVYETVALPLS